jgi:hypothetical protein
MSQIVFENRGEIDIRSITNFGLSVKEGENPIGFFGTGLKYAIAVLLRHDCAITIYSGLKRVDFAIRREEVRGKEFEFVTMTVAGGVPVDAGFTTQLGRGWDLWMAYRELDCNRRDEGGSVSKYDEPVEPREDFTFVAVEGEAFAAIYAESWKYLLDSEPDFVIGGIEIREHESSHFFYRGVRVMNLPTQAMYCYNSTDKIELTEDRTAKNPYVIPYTIARTLLISENEHVLRRVLTAGDDYLEHNLDFHGYGCSPSPAFLKVCGEVLLDRSVSLNPTALRVFEDSTKSEFEPRIVVLTEVQQSSLTRALAFCEKLGFRIEDNYEVRVVETLGGGCLGMARKGVIFVAEQAFHMGNAKQVASTLIEEFIHLKHGYADNSREMQNWLFEKLVSVGEELFGSAL